MTLTPFDRILVGWERYAAAGVDVIDTETGDFVVHAGEVVS